MNSSIKGEGGGVGWWLEFYIKATKTISRLDPFHFMNRIGAMATSKRHVLYPRFMAAVSGCIIGHDKDDWDR